MPDAEYPGLVLAGGRSTRMGEDKAEKMLDGKRLAHRAADRLVEIGCAPVFINSRNERLSSDRHFLLPDTLDGLQGPLAGILAGLQWTRENRPGVSHLLAVPTDVPFFPGDLLKRLAAAARTPATVAMAAYCGEPEPAFALWPVALAETLATFLVQGTRRSIRAFAEGQDTALVDFIDHPAHTFMNINTPADFARAEAILGLPKRPRILGIAGWKNSGKTGLTVRLVAELRARGYKVSTIKHAHHDFDIDKAGADSFRHREAGAHEVTIVSGTRYAIMHELRGTPEPAFEDVLARLAPCDIIIVEGYKREPVPKIEARRLEARNRAPLAPGDPHIVAIAADHAITDTALPVFDLDDDAAIADFAERIAGLRTRA